MPLSWPLELLVYIPPAICVPLSMYGNVKICKHRDAMFMQKRSLSLIFGLNTVSIISMISTTSVNVSIIHFHHHMAIWFMCWWLLLFFLTVKNWMIYFKYKWTYYTLQLQWQRIINPNVVKEINKNNWYIHNHKKYGNLSYIYKLFGSIYFTAFALNCIASTMQGSPKSTERIKIFSAILQISTVLPMILFYFIIVFKTPHYEDTFYIHWESKMHSKILIIMGFLCIVVNGVHVLFDDDIIMVMVAAPSLTLSFFAINYVSTVMICQKNKYNLRSPSLKIDDVTFEIDLDISLDMILKHEIAINLFMSHLSKEYSMECLLAFIELSQFQRYLIEQNHVKVDNAASSETVKVDDTNVVNLNLVEFPSNIPISAIIETEFKNEGKYDIDDNYIYNIKLKARKLYEKYIRNSAEFQINISSQQRDELENIFDDIDILMNINMNTTDLIMVFQDIKQELHMLLTFALNRFKITTEFEQITSILGNNKNNTNHECKVSGSQSVIV